MTNDHEPQSGSSKIQQLPSSVQEAMSSIENAEINREIAQKHRLKEEEIPVMVNIIVRTILKEISLADFPFVLKEVFRLDSDTAKAVSLEIATRRFYPLKDHLAGTESLIAKLGGEVPKSTPVAPKLQEAVAPTEPPKPILPPEQLIKKDLRSLLKENKEAGEQLITIHPIQLEGIDQLVRPSLKNWLSDYIRANGVGPNSLMERTEYLYKSANCKNLSDEERQILAKVFQSYDENTPLPVSTPVNLLDIEEIRKKEKSGITSEKTANKESYARQAPDNQDRKPRPKEEFLKSVITPDQSASSNETKPPYDPPKPKQAWAPQPRQKPNYDPDDSSSNYKASPIERPARQQTGDQYLESVENEKPLPPRPPRDIAPGPRLNRNIVDLSDR